MIMKYEKLVYAVGCLIVIVAALLKILHLPYSNYSNAMLMLTFGVMSAFQAWHVIQLKKKVKELEGK
jgi:hypothetical protein